MSKPFHLCLLALIASLASSAAAERPNIIVYMVDDLGWNHISAGAVTMGTHSKNYRTPNLEKLARGGLSFTHAYAQPNCAPTRAAMLSGQYPARIHNDVYVVNSLSRFNKNPKKGFTKKTASFIPQKQSEDVAPEAVTIAEAMKKNGYATAHIGKYHVGGHRGDETMPEKVGFDINIGGFSQGHQPTCFSSRKNGKWIFNKVGLGHFDPWAAPYDEEYLKEHKLPDDLLGSPKHISDAVGDALEDTLKKLTSEKKPFYLQFHTYAVHGPVRARPDLLDAAKVYATTKAEYSGFIAGVDENLRRMHAALDDPNRDGDTSDSIAKNTLILFTSDNGGTHAPNTPLKGHKGMITEGGIRVPLIAYWPGVIPAGTVTDYKTHCLDFYPSCLELAGGMWSPDPTTHPLDGRSFACLLLNPGAKDRPARDPIFYFFPGYMDIRAQPSAAVIDDLQGKRYKLQYTYESDSWELYCLTDDQPEAKNLIATKPKIAAILSKKIHTWLTQKHPTWKPKYPRSKKTGKPSGPPPIL